MYPKTRFTRKYRLIFMIMLIVAFFIISPIIIFYTAGYRFDWQTKQIKQTGVLSIDALPKDLNVYLNGVQIQQTLPIRLSNRTPGNYTLKLTRSGYQDWTKEITIESNKTTYIKNITLFKNNLPTPVMENFTETISALTSAFTGNYLAITSAKEKIYSIYLYNTATDKTTSLARFSSLIKPEIFWSPFADFLIIKYQSTDNNFAWQIINANNPDQTRTTTTTIETKEWQWSKNSSLPTVWLRNSPSTTKLSTSEEKILDDQPTTYTAWFVLDNDEIISYSTTTNEINWNNKKYNLDDDIWQIVDANEKRLIYKTSNETKVVKINNDDSLQITTMPVYNTVFNPQTNEWLAYSNWELRTIYADGDTELLYRTSEQMTFILPLDGYGVLLLANKNKISAFNPGYYISHELFNNGEIKKITTDVGNRKIYFWGKVGDKEGMFMLEY